VALGRAIVGEAPVCLLDEPLSNLDAQLRVDMRREIRSLQQRLGITMLYVTHDQLEAMTMADQVVLMRSGRVEQDGPPADLYERPATIFAARFIGSPGMNVLPAAAFGRVWQDLKGAAPKGRAPETLALGVRPEAARLASSGIGARIRAVEYSGADSLLDTRIGETPFVVRLAGRPPLGADERVAIAWDAGAMHWFDAASGLRIG